MSMADLFEEAGGKAAANNSVKNGYNVINSPFVRFLCDLMHTFPEEVSIENKTLVEFVREVLKERKKAGRKSN